MNNLQLFKYCSHCEDEKVIEIHNDKDDQQVPVSSTSASTELAEPTFCVTNVEKLDNVSIDLDLMRRIEDLNQISKAAPSDRLKSDSLHQPSVNYAHILSALEMTIKSMEAEESSEVEKAGGKTDADINIDSGQRKKQIELLWNDYRLMFPEEYVHMWSSLEQGLSDYLVHLKKRQQLHMECERLRQQNAQLKYMLQELL